MKKKVLKIIQIVYDFLSLGFIVFVIIAMAVSPKSEGHHDNNVSEIVENKTRKNEGYNDQYGHQYYYNTNDFGTYSFLTKMINYMLSKGEAYSDFSNASTNTISTHWAYSVNGATSLSGQLSYFSNDTYNGNWQVKWISFSKESGITYTTSYGKEIVECRYVLAFYSSSSLIDSNLMLAFEYTIQSPAPTLNYSELYGGLLYRWSISSNYSSLLISSGVYIENDFDGFCLFNEVGLNDTSNGVNQYNAGYNAGLRAGYDAGYVKGSSGVETNAFTAISQAFEAVSNILSIQVLPNLPLWVLVFTPLIIAVVIVVVKLIKG